jgi:LytS/YehU family sensor histidine kinase
MAPAQILTTYTVHYLGLALVGQRPLVTLVAWLVGLQGGIVWGTLTGFLYYWLILGVQAAFVYQRMYQQQRVTSAELEGRLTEARLEALRLQVHPHFLFNTLNAISAFVEADPERARRMISRLGDLLRCTLDSGTAAELPLARELDLLGPYLEIQRIRFGDRLSVEVDVTEGTSAERAGDRLRLEIADNGPGLTQNGDGIGLANTRARLAGLYGTAGRLELKGAASGTVVTIELPFRTAI